MRRSSLPFLSLFPYLKSGPISGVYPTETSLQHQERLMFSWLRHRLTSGKRKANSAPFLTHSPPFRSFCMGPKLSPSLKKEKAMSCELAGPISPSDCNLLILRRPQKVLCNVLILAFAAQSSNLLSPVYLGILDVLATMEYRDNIP